MHPVDLPEYTLLDCGRGERLERFAGTTVRRPAPGATGSRALADDAWDAPVVFRREDDAWRGVDALPSPWRMSCGAFVLELRPSAIGHVGVFPEQIENWRWTAERIGRRVSVADRPVRVLNVFAYTGASTLAALSAAPDGRPDAVEVCHVDGSKSAVSWARCNAECSGMADRPVRWMVEDALTWLRREVRRGVRYDGVILDPPAFGRGPKRKTWKFDRDLGELLDLTRTLLSETPLFAVLTAHAPELSARDLGARLASALDAPRDDVETLDMRITAEPPGKDLSAGVCARFAAD